MAEPARPILIYSDEGADPFCAGCLMVACRELHGAAEAIDAAMLLAGRWRDRCAALAFPGGADRPYAQKLNGRGNALIREYVEGGGRYLGVCAGAYYGCRRIDFTGADFAVREERELGFFPGIAMGSLSELAPPYRVQDLACAAAVDVETPAGPVTALYWGGCCFQPDANAADFEVLARYAALPPDRNIAAVHLRVGEGTAVLAGVHAEIGGEDLDRHRAEYAMADEPRLDEQIRLLRRRDNLRRALLRSILGALGLAGHAARA